MHKQPAQTFQEGAIVKSLLTGRQTQMQSVLRPDVQKQGQVKPSVATNQMANGRNVRATSVKTNQIAVNDGKTVATSQSSGQQMVYLPDNVAPGEVLYAVVDGVAYEIVGSSAQDGGGVQNVELGSGISLEDLANISAEQEMLKLNMDLQSSRSDMSLSNDKLQQQGQDSVGTMSIKNDTGTDSSAQMFIDNQYVEVSQGAGGTSVVQSEDGTQIIILPADYETSTGNEAKKIYGMDAQKTKLATDASGNQSIVLQAGQQIPEALQELMAQGVDLSNYEIVIQDPGTGDNSEILLTSDASQMTMLADGSLIGKAGNTAVSLQHPTSTILGTNASVNPNDVLAMLADASQAIAEKEHYESSVELDLGPDGKTFRLKNDQRLPMVMMATTEEEDGEFDFIGQNAAGGTSSEGPTIEGFGADAVNQQILQQKLRKPAQFSGFLTAYMGFVQGNKAETLSSVANSTVTRKPNLPVYVPEFTKKTAPVSDDFRSRPGLKTQGRYDSVGRGRGSKEPVQKVIYLSAEKQSKVGGSAASGSTEQTPVTQFVVQKMGEKTVIVPNYDQSKQSSVYVNADGSLKTGQVKRKRGDGSDDEEFADDGEFVTFSATDGEKGYDSDKDPMWKPGEAKSGEGEEIRVVRGRGRGRPSGRGRGGRSVHDQAAKPAETSETVTPFDPTEPHSFQRGDYVVERKDAYKYEGFAIWKIEKGRLLHKYEPVISDDRLVHQAAFTYSSWTGDIRRNYKAVEVQVVMAGTGNGREVVEVLKKYLPNAPEESVEQEPLMESFNVYLQSLVSQALEPFFLAVLKQEKDEYYEGPMRHIDSLIEQRKQNITAELNWTDEFKDTANKLPYFSLTLRSGLNANCRATKDSKDIPAVGVLRFFGPMYNPELLEVTGEVDRAASEAFIIGQPTSDVISVYHALQHFKFLVFKKCQDEVQYLKQDKNKSDSDILSQCLQNRVWVQKLFLDLKTLLDVTDSEEPQTEMETKEEAEPSEQAALLEEATPAEEAMPEDDEAPSESTAT